MIVLIVMKFGYSIKVGKLYHKCAPVVFVRLLSSCYNDEIVTTTRLSYKHELLAGHLRTIKVQ